MVERFPMGAPYVGGKIHGPPLGDLNAKARHLLIMVMLVWLFSDYAILY